MRRLRSRRARTATTAVVGLVAGVILGQVFNVSIKSSEVWTLVVSAFTVLCLVVFTALLNEIAEEGDDRSKDVIQAIQRSKTETTTAIDGLRDSIGQTVEYQVIEDLNHRIMDIREEPVTKAVLSAQHCRRPLLRASGRHVPAPGE